MGLGGAKMGLSQEVVQEFRVSTVNFGLPAGMTARGLGQRGHACRREQASSDSLLLLPRLQPGCLFGPHPRSSESDSVLLAAAVWLRGRRTGPGNRVFYFGDWERNDQRAVSATTLQLGSMRCRPATPGSHCVPSARSNERNA